MTPSQGTCPVCGTAAKVQWQRHPTTAEIAAFPAGQQLTAVTVYACDTHAISLALASRMHQSTCTAPNLAQLPGCSCTPDPSPISTPTTTTTLSSGWIVSS